MGTIAAGTVIDKARGLLIDENAVRWSDPELLDWLNEGQREIVRLNPAANATTAVRALIAGARQSLPTDGISLIEVSYNMGSDGATPGRAILLAERGAFNRQRPNWRQDTPSGVVRHYLYDPRTPRAFDVWPPQPAVAPGRVMLAYAVLPEDCASHVDPLSIDDVYEGPLLDYVLYRAHLKDAEHTADESRTMRFYQQFLASLGALQASRAITEPV